MNPDKLPADLFREWFMVAPTKAQVDAQVKANADQEARIMRDMQIDGWLRRHPEATCSRTVAGTLADLETTFAAELRKKDAAA